MVKHFKADQTQNSASANQGIKQTQVDKASTDEQHGSSLFARPSKVQDKGTNGGHR